MQRTSAVSRPAWANVIGGTGANRKSPIEIFANAASVVTRSSYAEAWGIRNGKFGHWTDGVAAMRQDCVEFAAYWHSHNERVLRELENDPAPDPAPCGSRSAIRPPRASAPRVRAAVTSARRSSICAAAPASRGECSTSPSPAR